MDTLITDAVEYIVEYITPTNIMLASLCYLYYITTVGYYIGIVKPAGALDVFPYPRIVRFFCLFWPLFISTSLIKEYIEGGKKV